MKVVLLFLAILSTLVTVDSHGHLLVPYGRPTLFLDGRYPDQPANWNYGQVWCDNVWQDMNYTTCGRCGDPLGVHDNEDGGYYGKGYISANYKAGSIIEVTGEFWYAHMGFFQVDLCPQAEETDDCFQPLQIVGGSEDIFNDEQKICVPYDGGPDQFDGWTPKVTAFVQLPEGVTCERCTLRWTYRASSYGWLPGWTICSTPHPSQTFRNCADVSISP